MTNRSLPPELDMMMSYLKEIYYVQRFQPQGRRFTIFHYYYYYVDVLLSFVVSRARFTLRLTSPTAFGVHILY